MPVLTAFNKTIPNRPVAFNLVPPPDGDESIDPRDYLTDGNISTVYNLDRGIAFSTQDRLVLTLEPQPLNDNTSELEPESVFWSGMARQGIGIWNSSLWFKDISPSPTGLQRDQYTSIQTGPINVTLNGNVAEIEVGEAFVNAVQNSFQRRNIRLPGRGMLRLVYERHFVNRNGDDQRNRTKDFLWVQVTFNGLVRRVGRAERRTSDLISSFRDRASEALPLIRRRSLIDGLRATVPARATFRSEPTPYENLHVPALSGCFIYNFFEVNERDFDASRLRNFSLKNLNEIPKYVELNWNPVPATLVTRPPLSASFISTPRLHRRFSNRNRFGRFNSRNPLRSPTSRVRNSALFATGILAPSASFFRRRAVQNPPGESARSSTQIRFPSQQSPRSPFFNLFGGRSVGGSRVQPERTTRRGRTLRLGGRTFSIGGHQEEEAGIFGSRTRTSRLATSLSQRANVQPTIYQPGGLFSAFADSSDRLRLTPGSSGRLSLSPRRRRRRARATEAPSENLEPSAVGDDTTTNLGLSEEEDELLQDLVRDVDQPDAIAGPNEFSRYIGYVLIKERFNPESDSFEPVDLMAILDRRKTRITDTKVAYGEVYRYKIRSVFKFVNVDNLPLFRDQDSILSESVTAVFDGGEPFLNAFYFDSKFSDPVEVLCTENKRPDPPYSFQLFPNSKKKEIFITWSQKQPERDVVGYNIYRRTTLSGSRFERINTNLLRVRENFFIDRQIDFDKDYVYAIHTIDVHNNPSLFSVQKSTRIRSQDFSLGRVESGIKTEIDEELEAGETETPDETKDIIVFKKNLHLVVNPLFGNLDREATYLLKIRSLDTFEEKDIKLNFKTKIITHRRILASDEDFEERRDEIESEFEDVEQERFGVTRAEIIRRRDRRTRGRDEFEE